MQHLQSNTTLQGGKYRIEKVLGQGGFGNTYEGTNTIFDERIAIKEFFMLGINDRDGDTGSVSVSLERNKQQFEEQREKFKKEALRIRKLNNPHIIKVHDLFEENGTVYYVMDYVDGETLAERLKRTRQPMTEQEVKKLLPQILDALRSVHDAGIWHLDLKPANIMVDKDDNVKLIDFGASKQLNAQKGGATTSTAISYTNGYAPREQMEQNYDKFVPWTDLYALGATLYNLLTNKRPPLPTDIDDDMSDDKHLALPMPNVSDQMKHLVLCLMKTNRLQRPQDINAVKELKDEAKPKTTPPSIPLVPQEANEEETIIASKKEEPKKNQYTAPTPPPHKNNVATQNNNDDNLNNHSWIWVILIACAFIGSFWLLGTCYSDNSNTTTTVGTKVEDKSNVELSDFHSSIGVCRYVGPIDEDNRPNGVGEAFFDDYRYYKGNFKHGILDGDNAYFKYPNGDVFQGTFRENSFFEGVYTVAETQEYFKGTFQNGQPNHGTWYNKNDEIIEYI